jgi:FkbM family methyltransferase
MSVNLAPVQSPYLTTVIDVGARYGMHPSWSGFRGELKYFAFEPDTEEAERLRQTNDKKSFEVIEAAVFNKEGEFDFNLLVHRGMSSFLTPDLESESFKDLKPGLGDIEKTIKIRTKPLDSFTTEHHWSVDFLKVDTEGTEHEVIESAEKTIESGVLGVRSSVNFNPAFHDQKLFSATHDFLVTKGFMLLNIDYFGFGYPKLGLFKKPDPSFPESRRYGVLVGCDAVWIRRPGNLNNLERCSERLGQESSVLKLAYFCLLNDAPDVAADILNTYCLEQSGWRLQETLDSRLYKSLRIDMLKYLGQWRTVPDETWDKARTIFRVIFSEELEGGSGFYPQLQNMVADLGSLT